MAPPGPMGHMRRTGHMRRMGHILRFTWNSLDPDLAGKSGVQGRVRVAQEEPEVLEPY